MYSLNKYIIKILDCNFAFYTHKNIKDNKKKYNLSYLKIDKFTNEKILKYYFCPYAISSIRDIVRAGAEAALVKDLKRRKYLYVSTELTYLSPSLGVP